MTHTYNGTCGTVCVGPARSGSGGSACTHVLLLRIRQHTSAHTSAYVSAYVSIRQVLRAAEVEVARTHTCSSCALTVYEALSYSGTSSLRP